MPYTMAKVPFLLLVTLCADSGLRAVNARAFPAFSGETFNFGAGGIFPEWGEMQEEGGGLTGWSYYIRAFDLFKEQAVSEVGWGQWTKPQGLPVEVCSVHPYGFNCDQDWQGRKREEKGCRKPRDEDDDASTCVAHCDGKDWKEMEKCTHWVCGTKEKGGVKGSIEGGMGYWMYHVEKPMVSWLIPGTTTANYEAFGGTFLADRPQPCINMGGAVRVSNELLVPNDAVTFEDPDSAFGRDGFLGYMLQRTGLGKRSPTDDANYWTIIADAGNFAGPVLMISSYFWDMRTSWHPKSQTWSDPRIKIGMVQEGFEGSVGAYEAAGSGGSRYFRTTKWGYPVDDSADGKKKKTSTLFTAHTAYKGDWASNGVLEAILDGSDKKSGADAVRMSSRAAGTPPPDCSVPSTPEPMGMEDDAEKIMAGGFGVASDPDASDVKSTRCANRLALDEEKLDCTSRPGWCLGSPYIKQKSKGKKAAVSVPASAVPKSVKAKLDAKRFPDVRVDSRKHHSPAEPEQPCFDIPGPASATLYCVRTAAKAWVGFRWYRFVDQPEMMNVFAAMPDDEVDEVKEYMQARIVRMHKMQERKSAKDPVPRWFDEGEGFTLPAKKINFDPNLLLTPPKGLEYGYVPVPVYHALRAPPPGCVQPGSAKPAREPEPLPADYYDGETVRRFMDDDREQLICLPREGEAEGYSYPGKMFIYSANRKRGKDAYDVPKMDDLKGMLEAKFKGKGGPKPTPPPTDPPTPPPTEKKLACTLCAGAEERFRANCEKRTEVQCSGMNVECCITERDSNKPCSNKAPTGCKCGFKSEVDKATGCTVSVCKKGCATPTPPPTEAATNPVKAPTYAPVTTPVTSPTYAPVAAPVTSPTYAPVAAPVTSPTYAPVAAPVTSPTSAVEDPCKAVKGKNRCKKTEGCVFVKFAGCLKNDGCNGAKNWKQCRKRAGCVYSRTGKKGICAPADENNADEDKCGDIRSKKLCKKEKRLCKWEKNKCFSRSTSTA